MENKTPMSLLRAVIEEQRYMMPCDTLHEVHGDGVNNCGDRDCYECKIDALRKAADLVEAELNALKARALPEGMEWLIGAWPKFEDDAPVKLGDMALIDGDVDMVEAVQIWIHGKPVIYGDNGSQQLEKGERVKRPAVLAADGEPLEVGQTVWDANGDELVIGAIENGGHTVTCRYVDVGDGIPVHVMWSPSDLTHQRPVLDADGVPIKNGDTVWLLDDCGRAKCGCEVIDTCENVGEFSVMIREVGKYGYSYVRPSSLTHTKPEPPDSWERIEEDVTALAEAETNGRGIYNMANDYCNARGLGDGTVWVLMARDLVRRAKALSERGE